MPTIKNASVPKLAIATLGLVALTSCFLWLAKHVLHQDLITFDERTTAVFRDAANGAKSIGPPWLAEGVRDFTSLGSVTVSSLMVLLAVGFLLLQGLGGHALFVAVCSAGSLALNSVLKIAIERPRPSAIDVSPLVFTSSFPSGHAALSAATYLSLAVAASEWVDRGPARRYLFTAAIALTVLVGLSRVYLGLHRPTDVLAGWIIGLAWFLFTWLLAEALSIIGIRQNVSSPNDLSGLNAATSHDS